jgi:hypothetical protein
MSEEEQRRGVRNEGGWGVLYRAEKGRRRARGSDGGGWTAMNGSEAAGLEWRVLRAGEEVLECATAHSSALSGEEEGPRGCRVEQRAAHGGQGEAGGWRRETELTCGSHLSVTGRGRRE